MEDGGPGAIVVLLAGDVHVAAWRIHTSTPPDLSLVDELARLQLAARRLGLSVRLQAPCRGLCQLLDLVGLADLLIDGPVSGVDAGWEPEGGEQLRVQEVVQPGDPPV